MNRSNNLQLPPSASVSYAPSGEVSVGSGGSGATSAAVSPALVSKNLGAAAAGERQQGRLALSLEVA